MNLTTKRKSGLFCQFFKKSMGRLHYPNACHKRRCGHKS